MKFQFNITRNLSIKISPDFITYQIENVQLQHKENSAKRLRKDVNIMWHVLLFCSGIVFPSLLSTIHAPGSVSLILSSPRNKFPQYLCTSSFGCTSFTVLNVSLSDYSINAMKVQAYSRYSAYIFQKNQLKTTLISFLVILAEVIYNCSERLKLY